MSNPLVPEEVRKAVAPPGVAVFGAERVLWHGTLAEDFALWMIGEGHFDGSLWPVYQRINAEDPAAAAAQMLQFYAGLDVRRIRALVERFWQVSPARKWLMRVRSTVRWAAEQGLGVHVVSSTPAPLLEPLSRHLGVDRVLGADLETDGDSRATGRCQGAVPIGEGKANRIRGSNGDPIVLAVGSSWLDIPMLRCSEGVAWAINPDPELRDVAGREGWLVSEEPEE